MPEQYWNGSNTRNTAANAFLTANVPNPYFINNFAALRTTDPVLYQRLASNPTFSSATIQRSRLLRPFGALTNLTYANLPLGESKAHSLEVQVNRRLSNGLTGFFSFNANSVRYNRTVEEYEREPTLWQGSNDARPWRLAGAASYELPFGRGKRFLSDGGVVAALASNWQVSGTWEFQPGALLDWGGQNIFFYGDLDDIDVDDPTRERWFNIDAGFERDPARTPAGLPEARLPVPHRRGARHAADVREPVDPAQLRRRRQAHRGRSGSTRRTSSTASSGTDRTLNPTSTQFGQVTTVALNQMRFFTFGIRATFYAEIALGRAQTMKRVLVVIGALAALGARPAGPRVPGTASLDAEHCRGEISVPLPGQPGVVPGCRRLTRRKCASESGAAST